MKVLLVEDNKRVARFVTKGLRDLGHIVDHTDNGRDGTLLAAKMSYDTIIMDRMLPGEIDGLAAIEAIRKLKNRTPILILSALSDVDERIKGLKSGGDDYLTKPFAFGELLARLEAMNRRAHAEDASTSLSVGNLHMDLLARTVTRGKRAVTLLPQEFKLLEYLMRHQGQIVTRAMMLENVWEFDSGLQSNVLDVHICKLRKKIDFASEPSLLRTIRNTGYIMSAEG
jgi:two-component system, OmpR family, response regulator